MQHAFILGPPVSLGHRKGHPQVTEVLAIVGGAKIGKWWTCLLGCLVYDLLFCGIFLCVRDDGCVCETGLVWCGGVLMSREQRRPFLGACLNPWWTCAWCIFISVGFVFLEMEFGVVTMLYSL